MIIYYFNLRVFHTLKKDKTVYCSNLNISLDNQIAKPRWTVSSNVHTSRLTCPWTHGTNEDEAGTR